MVDSGVFRPDGVRVAYSDSYGGSSGNILLRQMLGWDESAYEAVKANLVAAGKVRPGRGKGGSVSLNESGESFGDEP